MKTMLRWISRFIWLTVVIGSLIRALVFVLVVMYRQLWGPWFERDEILAPIIASAGWLLIVMAAGFLLAVWFRWSFEEEEHLPHQ